MTNEDGFGVVVFGVGDGVFGLNGFKYKR